MRGDDWPPIEFWEIPTNATVRESPAASISEEDKAAFDRTLRAAQRDSTTNNGELIVYLGVDMGTSSTKVVARLPYVVDSPCILIPAPQHCRSDDNPALWQTVLWRRGDTFSALPSSGATPIRNLKQAAMRAAADNAASDSPAIREAAAYLGYVIRHAKGWLLTNRTPIFTNLMPRWVIQVGLPAKSCEDSRLAKAYRRIALAATHLSSLPDETTTGIVSTTLRSGKLARAAESNDTSLQQGVAVFPEIAAATTSFSKSNDRTNGLYLIVDVGAMTLDVCTFSLSEKDSMDMYSVFAADVRPLGVEARHWFRKMGKSDQELAMQVARCLRTLVANTKTGARFPEFQAGNDLPIFLVGGGAKSRFHQERIEELSKWMGQYYAHEGLRRIDIRFTTGVDMTGIAKGQEATDLSRLVVALGLSYPDDEIGKLVLPSEVAPLEPKPPPNYDQNFVSKDQV